MGMSLFKTSNNACIKTAKIEWVIYIEKED